MTDWVQRHPYLTAFLVLATIILFVIIKRRSASGGGGTTAVSSGPSEQLQAAQLAAGVQTQQFQAQAQIAANQTNAALAAKQLDIAGQLQIAGLQRDVALQNIVTSGELHKGDTNAQIAAIRAQTGAQVAIAGQQVQAQLGVAGIQAGVQYGAQRSAVQQQQIISDAATQQAGFAAGVAIHGFDVQGTTDLAKIASDVTIAGYGRDVSLAGISATTDQAQIAAKQNIVIAGFGRDIALSGIAADVTKAGYGRDIQQAAIKGGVDIAALQEATKRQFITTSGDVSKLAITTSGAVASKYADFQILQQQGANARFQGVLASVGNLSSGQSRNERAALLASYGPGGAGAAAAIEAPITAGAPGNSFFGALTGIGNLLTGAGNALWGGSQLVGARP